MTSAVRPLPGLLGSPSVDRCLVMGVVNVTPDSFSDGGLWFDTDRAVAHGFELVADGADVVDVGGESTRPGAVRVDLDEELRRVVPVVRELAAAGVAVSVDTMRAEVAEQSLGAGAVLVNDVSGGRADPRVMSVVASSGAPVVLMHWREHSAAMHKHTQYDDLVADVVRELLEQVDAARRAGVRDDQVVVDPGLGFSKTGAQNWTVLAHLEAFRRLGFPLLVAASRKRFLGELLAAAPGGDGHGGGALRDVHEREDATTALTTVAAQAGAWCVRVHEPRASADAVRVVARVAAAGGEGLGGGAGSGGKGRSA